MLQTPQETEPDHPTENSIPTHDRATFEASAEWQAVLHFGLKDRSDNPLHHLLSTLLLSFPKLYSNSFIILHTAHYSSKWKFPLKINPFWIDLSILEMLRPKIVSQRNPEFLESGTLISASSLSNLRPSMQTTQQRAINRIIIVDRSLPQKAALGNSPLFFPGMCRTPFFHRQSCFTK